MKHEFSINSWCIKCGQSRYEILENITYKECLATDNVVAISDLVRTRTLFEILNASKQYAFFDIRNFLED